MSLPTFLIIGAMKAGTTSLYEYVRSHPDVYMPWPKELRFFVAEENWPRGREWYGSMFEPGKTLRARGEASPYYTMAHAYHGVPERIAGLVPDVKLIYLLRDPIERIRSHYMMLFAEGRETRPAERALREFAGYVLTSSYAMQVEQYLPFFPREQILLITSEQLRRERLPTLRQVFEFIDVEPNWEPPNVAIEIKRANERRVRLRSVDRFRNTPVYRTAARLAPARLRSWHHRMTTRPADQSLADISLELERELRAKLRSDVQRLHAYMPPGFDGWGIA